MPAKEATARIKINKLLEAAGWRFFPDANGPANIHLSSFAIRARFEENRALPLFYAYFFKRRYFPEMIEKGSQGANIRNLLQGILADLKVPLPPLPTQQAIVLEIEAEQPLVDANRRLIERFEKKIQATLARVWGEEEPAQVEE